MQHVLLQWWTMFVVSSLEGYFLFTRYPQTASNLLADLSEREWVMWILYAGLLVLLVMKFTTKLSRPMKLVVASGISLVMYCSTAFFPANRLVEYSLNFASVLVGSCFIWLLFYSRAIGWCLLTVAVLIGHGSSQWLLFN